MKSSSRSTTRLRLLALAALLGAAPALGAQDASRDSARVAAARARRAAQLEARIDRLRREIEQLEQQRLAAERSRSDAAADSMMLHLEPRIRAAARALGQLEATVGARGGVADATAMARRMALAPVASEPGPVLAQALQPRGWMGVNYSGAQRVESSSKGLFIYHYDYPVVLSVEPASPAERAGLMAGDTVLAYDGKDLKQRRIALGAQLRPGARVVVRVKRDGEVLDVPVKIERRPATFRWYDATMPPVPPAAAAVAVTPSRPRTPAAAPLVAQVLPVSPPTPPAPPVTAVFGGWTTTVVAGAEVTRMTTGLRDALGVPGSVPNGVVVLSVAPGSPAAAAGLHSGDVVYRLNGTAVTSPQTLQRAVQTCDTRLARLDLVRKKKETYVTLKW